MPTDSILCSLTKRSDTAVMLQPKRQKGQAIKPSALGRSSKSLIAQSFQANVRRRWVSVFAAPLLLIGGEDASIATTGFACFLEGHAAILLIINKKLSQ